MAHHRYRAMRPIVRAFCQQHGLSYQQVGLYRALASVGIHLGSITAAFHAASRRE